MKPEPVVVLYELRMVRALRPLPALRAVEARVKKWRGMLRWTMQAFTSPRGEAIVQIVGERSSHVTRRDNLYASWQRLVEDLGGVSCARGCWASAASGASYFADARTLHEGYDAVVARVGEEAARADSGVVSCTDLLPLLPLPVAAAVAGGVIAPSAPSAPSGAAAVRAASQTITHSPSRSIAAAHAAADDAALGHAERLVQPQAASVAGASAACTKIITLPYQAFSAAIEPRR
jgi:hypothetical protein